MRSKYSVSVTAVIFLVNNDNCQLYACFYAWLEIIMNTSNPPLIAHVIHHLGVGGLENGLVNLVNTIPPERYRHAIICLKGYSDFHRRIKRRDVAVIALNKREGSDFKVYSNLFKLFKQLEPDIVHTRNLAAMEGQVIAAWAGVRARVHGEHGRDIFDLEGKSRKYNLLRKIICPFIHHFIAVSKDLEKWLINTVKVNPDDIDQIYNGVDSSRFCPSFDLSPVATPHGFINENSFVIGSVGRMAEVKDYPNLVQAFLLMLDRIPEASKRLRLLIVGEGEVREKCITMIRSAKAENLAWFPGERTDIPELMRVMDLFVLPSLGEGISNTILEAMSSGLPVVATKVGGNIELVKEGKTGKLIPPSDPEILAEAIFEYYRNQELLTRQGYAARQLIECGFGMDVMTNSYLKVYDKVLGL